MRFLVAGSIVEIMSFKRSYGQCPVYDTVRTSFDELAKKRKKNAMVLTGILSNDQVLDRQQGEEG